MEAGTNPFNPTAPKYRNRKTEVDGITFDSVKEAKRYRELKLVERAGRIRQLEVKPQFELVAYRIKIGRYTADFRYQELKDGDWVEIVEDVKGFKTRDYILRKKLMLACHGIEIRET